MKVYSVTADWSGYSGDYTRTFAVLAMTPAAAKGLVKERYEGRLDLKVRVNGPMVGPVIKAGIVGELGDDGVWYSKW